MNVAAESRILAETFGGVAPDTAYFAGMVHDICKEMDESEQFNWMMHSDMGVCPEEKKSPKVWHGIAGACYLREKFGVTDPDLLRAVRFHTVGRAGMSQLEKIVFLADLTSAERTYPDVEHMREVVHRDLNDGMYEAVCFSIQKQLKRHGLLPHYTIEAYNEYAALQQ